MRCKNNYPEYKINEEIINEAKRLAEGKQYGGRDIHRKGETQTEDLEMGKIGEAVFAKFLEDSPWEDWERHYDTDESDENMSDFSLRGVDIDVKTRCVKRFRQKCGNNNCDLLVRTPQRVPRLESHIYPLVKLWHDGEDTFQRATIEGYARDNHVKKACEFFYGSEYKSQISRANLMDMNMMGMDAQGIAQKQERRRTGKLCMVENLRNASNAKVDMMTVEKNHDKELCNCDTE
jgi:hypothetical protein